MKIFLDTAELDEIHAAARWGVLDGVRELAAIVRLHGLDAEVLAASIRHPRHVTEAALAGAHIATVPHKVLRQMIHHPLTATGIVQFRRDWEAVQSTDHNPVRQQGRLTTKAGQPRSDAASGKTRREAAHVAT